MPSAITNAILQYAPAADLDGLGFNTLSSASGGGNSTTGGSGLQALGVLSNFLGDKNKKNTAKKAYKAYQGYLNGIVSQMKNELEGRAEKYDFKLQDQFREAEPQFQQEAGTQLPELTQLVNDIAQQSAESQRQNRLQTQTELVQQGIRGGQAAILSNRATGELNRNLQRDINKNIYEEALNRQNSRLNYYGQKALTPWQTMSQSYGSSMIGANNALSNAQGQTYANAYNRAMNNYINQASNKKSRLGNALGGALSGATTGASLGGSWGALGGAVVGGAMGAI